MKCLRSKKKNSLIITNLSHTQIHTHTHTQKVLETHVRDGYNVARVQWVVDVDVDKLLPSPSGTEAVASGSSAVDSGLSAVDRPCAARVSSVTQAGDGGGQETPCQSDGGGSMGAGSMAAAVESVVGGRGGNPASTVVSTSEYEGGDLGGNALEVEHQRFEKEHQRYQTELAANLQNGMDPLQAGNAANELEAGNATHELEASNTAHGSSPQRSSPETGREAGVQDESGGGGEEGRAGGGGGDVMMSVSADGTVEGFNPQTGTGFGLGNNCPIQQNLAVEEALMTTEELRLACVRLVQ
jgi:hypothetical protein